MSGSASPDPIELWALRSVDEPLLRSVERWTSDEERARYGRLRVRADRERQLATRGMLREVLARHLGVAAADVTFGEVGRGKPVLVGPGPRFSVSHCDGLSLVAVSTGPVGVDGEPLAATVEPEVAERICTVAELAGLGEPGGEAWRRQLLGLWVRKEAVVKVDERGRGLELDVRELDVADVGAPDGWQRWGMDLPALVDLAVGGDHVAALAWTGEGTVGPVVEWRPE